MRSIKLKVNFFVEGKKLEAGTVHEFEDRFCQALVNRNDAEYVPVKESKTDTHKETETDAGATVTVKSLGRKRTVTEP